MSWPRPDTLPTAPVVWLGMTASIEATATMAATAIGRERSGQANGSQGGTDDGGGGADGYTGMVGEPCPGASGEPDAPLVDAGGHGVAIGAAVRRLSGELHAIRRLLQYVLQARGPVVGRGTWGRRNRFSGVRDGGQLVPRDQFRSVSAVFPDDRTPPGPYQSPCEARKRSCPVERGGTGARNTMPNVPNLGKSARLSVDPAGTLRGPRSRASPLSPGSWSASSGTARCCRSSRSG